MLAPADLDFSRSFKTKLFHRKTTKYTLLVRFAWGGTQDMEPSSPLSLALGQEAAGVLLAPSTDGEEQEGRAAQCHCFALHAVCQPQCSQAGALSCACSAQSTEHGVCPSCTATALQAGYGSRNN